MMKILGIDPGFGLCGFAVLQTRKSEIPHLKTFGVIRTSAKKEFADRLSEIADDFQGLLDLHKPEVVSIEDLFFVQNVTTGMDVAHVRGVLIFLCQKAGVRIRQPKPVEVKHCFTGNGKATKSEMKKMAQILFQLEQSPRVDDAADALAVAYWAAQSVDFSSKK